MFKYFKISTSSRKPPKATTKTSDSDVSISSWTTPKESVSNFVSKLFTSTQSTPEMKKVPSKILIVAAQNDSSKLGTTVRQILDHPEIGKRFREYAAKLHADEGIQFLDKMKELMETEDNFKESVSILMNTFICDKASTQVNLSDEIRKEIFEKYENDNYSSIFDLFQEAMHEIFTDIKKSDTFRVFINQDVDAKRISNDETILLDEWMTMEHFRLALSACQNDEILCNRIRFCISADEYEKEDVISRKSRGQKISTMFIQPGSVYEFELPNFYKEQILKGNFSMLSDARLECLQVLAQSQILMQTVRKNMATIHDGHQLPRPSKLSISFGTTMCLQEIQDALNDPERENEIVKKLFEIQAPLVYINKVRFCIRVLGMQRVALNNVRSKRAESILNDHVVEGCPMPVNIPSGFVEDLLTKRDSSATLIIVCHQFLQEIREMDYLAKIIA